MFKKAVFVLSVIFIVLMTLPGAVLAAEEEPGLERTAAPVLSQDEMVCGAAAKEWSLLIALYDQEYGQYPGGTSVAFHVSAAGEAAGEVRVEAKDRRRGSVSYLESCTATGPAPQKETVYYVSVTEPGKLESPRVPFTVHPYSEESAAYVEIKSDPLFACAGAEAADETAARAKLLALLNGRIETGRGISGEIFREGDLTVTGFTPAKYGNPGVLTAELSVYGKTLDVALAIGAEEYLGELHYVLEEVAVAPLLRRSTPVDSGDWTRIAMRAIATAKVHPDSPAPDADNFKLSRSGTDLAEITDGSARISGYGYHHDTYNYAAMTIEYMDGRWRDGDRLYVWYVDGQVSQCIGSTAVRVEGDTPGGLNDSAAHSGHSGETVIIFPEEGLALADAQLWLPKTGGAPGILPWALLLAAALVRRRG